MSDTHTPLQNISKHKYLTAIDLDKNHKSIINIVEERTIEFNKKRLNKEYKKYLELKRIENNDITLLLTKDEKIAITNTLLTDNETKRFRESEYNFLSSQKENYYNFRKTIDSLNDLDKYAIEAEKYELQKISNFLKYEDILLLSLSKNNILKSIIKSKNNDINERIESLKDLNDEDINFDKPLDYLIIMREMYNTSTDIDDFILFDKFNLENNIDYSYKLSNLLFHFVSIGKLSKNILNELLPKNSINTNAQVISNKQLAIFFSDLISNNSVTTLKTTYTNNTNFDKVYRTRTIGELILEITNEENSWKSKESRQQIYMTYDGTRPSKEQYYKWNGLQVYDLDLKYWIKRSGGSIEQLKESLHIMLSDFHWYLWICTSASGNGLHIYTKVTAPHHVYIKSEDNEYISQYYYMINYVNKQSNIYDALYRLHKIPNNNIDFTDFYYKRQDIVYHEFNDVKQNKYLDNVVSRITAGIRLAYDPHPLINHNFCDVHVGFGLSQTLDGLESQETIESVHLQKNKLIDIINNNLVVESLESHIESKNKGNEIDLSKFVSLNLDIDEIRVLPKTSVNYVTRYNVCNTLASLFGKDGLQIAHRILDSHGFNNEYEINSFYSCAISNIKEPSKIGLELLKKAGIIKHIEPELIELTEKSYKEELKSQIENTLINVEDSIDYKLLNGQYISDIGYNLVEDIVGDKVNIILSPAGSGKTEWILRLARAGKRIMLVLPYISVIKNKVENDDEITELFDTFYGSKDIKDIEYGRNVVTTFDKFSRANYEKLSTMFDYYFLDESHLLFTSSYRIEATSNVIKKIKDLYYISSNNPFAGKIVLMTGTETGEEYFFNKVANIKRISKPQLTKDMEFLICSDTLDSLTRLASKAANLISDGYTLMIPTNKGEIYSEKIIGMIEHLLSRKVKFGYYKRSNLEQEICTLINEDNTVGDYEIIFCSNYLSVGIDINDRDKKFASIYLGNFSGYEIEQFNARIRKTGIRSLYCITTNKSDGTTNDLLLNEPDLLLKITDEDKLFFIDDKSVASAKTEFIASYDPVLHKIVTPGFSLMNGKIQFNIEEYELISFENKYSECMEHPLKVARELARYNYNITVSTEFEGLSNTEQNTLKQMGLEAAKNEKIRKHNLLVGTFSDLINNNTFKNDYGLEFTETIEWIMKNNQLIIEDRELTKNDEPCFVFVVFDVFATPQQVIVRSKEALEKMLKPALYLIKRYTVTKALEIISQYVDDNGILKISNFQRAINLLRLIDGSEANELAEPITKSLEKMYLFIDKFETNKDYRVGYETYQSLLDTWTNEYIDMLGIKINTKYGFEKIRNGLLEMIKDVATIQKNKNGIRFVYNKLPEQDSTGVKNRKSIDTLVTTMFNITDSIISNKKVVKTKHIILHEQSF